MNKMIDDKQFQALLLDGMKIHVGGFMGVGTPEPLMDLIVESKVKDLTIICNDAGYPDVGVGKLIKNNQVKHLIASHIGLNPVAGKLMMEGSMQVTLVPQGTLVEQIRAYGSGLGGVLTKTGLGTIVEDGKDKIIVDGQTYILEKPLGADMALIRGSFVDPFGNVIYRATTRNFNPIMATAAKTVVVWAEKIVDELDKEKIMTPHIFVDYILRG
ncbi:MAG TPA: 3-oxoacid CoA-transferase subunit A [Bacilli bacterium]|nr:3-oxoacid CoA-transferase subunit A [Bacilli bacterium]